MTTVLFVHGLESGPRGRKAQALEQAGYTVVAGQMPSGRRGAMRDPVVLGVLALEGLGISVDPKTRSLKRERTRSLKQARR
jgi:hypothetical protein